MPDIGVGHGGRGTVCVIGAGISGLAAAKIFSTAGFRVRVVEKGAALGGVWDPARSYPGVQTQTPRDLYAFSDFPMPDDYPEWPTGPQMFAYLTAYAAHFGLDAMIRYRTEVTEAAPDGNGWRVALRDGSEAASEERYDYVLVCTGQFSRPRTLPLPGADAFVAAGGTIRHSCEHTDPASAAGRDVVVLGFSKSATDVAMDALTQGAHSVTVVYREPVWKIPYFFGGLVNFKNILYCRASEAMFSPWTEGALGRIGRAVSKPMIWANWRALETLLNAQFGLKKLGLRPAARIEDTIHCGTSIETPGFYRAVRDGRIAVVQGTIGSVETGAAIVGERRLSADLIVLAIGWTQELPFLPAAVRDTLVEADGQHRLYQWIVNPDVPHLGFVGFNSSFVTSLSAELSAQWAARYFAGTLTAMPARDAMMAAIDANVAWRRTARPVAAGYGGLCVAPFHHVHFDALMAEMGGRTRPANPIVANLLPISPARYARLLASAPALNPVPETAA